MLKNQRFGVEIEMTGLTREQVANIIGQYFNTNVQYVGQVYQAYQVKDNQGRNWKTMYDGSINTEGRTDAYRCELVTPPLKYEDIETLQEIVRLIRQSGGKVNSSCGIHVHVDGANHTADSLKNLLDIIRHKQKILEQVLNIPNFRKSYCQNISEEFYNRARKNKKTLEQIESGWYNGNHTEKTKHYHKSRYHNLNLHSFFYRGTVEFRMFNSTLHAGKVKAYIQLCLAISARAIEAPVGHLAFKPQESSTKQQQVNWLKTLGLKGKEFETARLHLSANLE
jgi:Putative amidoligase enzyme.